MLLDVGGVLLDLASVREDRDAFVRALADRRRAALGEHFRAREGTVDRPAREGYAAYVTGQVLGATGGSDLFSF